MAINIFILAVKSPLASVADVIFWCVFQKDLTLWYCKLPSKAKRMTIGFHLVVVRSCGLLWGLRWFRSKTKSASSDAIFLYQRISAFWLKRTFAKNLKCSTSVSHKRWMLAFMNLEKISAPYISKSLLRPRLDGEFDCGKYEICSKLFVCYELRRVHCLSV